MKKLAHLAGALMLAAGGTLGLALPAAAAPTLTAPAWGALDEVVTVSGTECAGEDAVVTLTSSDEPDPYQLQPAEDGTWGAEYTLGTDDVTIFASCSTYGQTVDYSPVTIQVWQDAIGEVTRAACVVTIPVTVAAAGNYAVEVGDDGDTIASIPFTAAAAGPASVTWTIEKPALPGDPGVALILVDAQGDYLDYIDPYEFPDDVSLGCAQVNVTLSFPGYSGSVTAGSTLRVEAAGFLPGEPITITMYSTPVVLATLLADSQGRVLQTVTIPAATAPGEHIIEVKGQSSGLTISSPILVKAGSAGPTTTTYPTTTKYVPLLAKTGTTASALLPWAAGLVLLGGAALAFTRRRSSSH